MHRIYSALVGFPDIAYIRFDLTINVIPFVGMASDFHNACLNVLLFVPLGIFLPLLWAHLMDIVCGTVVFIMFFIQSFVSSLFWEMILV